MSERRAAPDSLSERLQADLEKTQLRLEEVAAYYRGELEASRQRAEDEAVRVQAAEAGRRRRAEEQVAYLKGELKAARADAEHAQRRYQELRQRLDDVERYAEARNQEEMKGFQEAARAAWRTAEEEVERLDHELSDLQRRLEQEREERHQVERAYEQLEERHQLAEEERRRLIARLKRALKMSEARRGELTRQLAAAGRGTGKGRASGLVRGEHRVEVDPGAGWGSQPLGAGSDFSDEFLMADADESLTPQQRAARREAEARAAHAAPEVSDQEAETLMMQLAVDQRVEERRRAATPDPAAAPAAAAPAPAAARGAEAPARPRGRGGAAAAPQSGAGGALAQWKWPALAALVCVAAGGVALALL